VTAPPVLTVISPDTRAVIDRTRLLSDRIVGMGFTVEGSSWRGAWPDGHDHVADSMAILWVEVSDCPRCMEHEFPGWHVVHPPGGAWSGSDGTRIMFGRSRTQFMVRLSVASLAAR
jgi:hypothetical protein